MRGSQEPTICVEPARTSSDGRDAIDLMAAYGNQLDPWQELIVNCWLGKNEQGEYTVTSAGITVPRQNGKNVCIEAMECFGMIFNGEKILHTAHQVKTAKKSFRRLERVFTDRRHPEILDTVKHIRYTNGEECIELKNGGSVEFSARSRQAARGFDGISRVIFDEAQELTDEQLEAILATLSASATGTRQIVYAGTVPYPGCPGTVFRRRREICLSSPGPHDAWHEWGVSGKTLEDIKLDDTTIWYMTNPALGIHLTEEFTKEERRTMSPDGFARERLGWWSPVIEKSVEKCLEAKAWEACASDEKKPEGKAAYGIKFTADGSEVVLCGAVCPEEGPARISLIDRKPTGYGTKWLVDWLNARYGKASCVVIDGRNGVDVLVEKISGTWIAKGSVIRPSAKDMLAAVSTLTNEVNERTVTWYREQKVLNDSAISSVKRPLSGGWAFGGEDPAPLEACALALWGARNSRRDPLKRMKIG